MRGSIEKVKARFREDKTFRIVVGVALALVTVPPGVAMLIFPGASRNLLGEAYVSVFAVNFLTQFPVVPVPGASSLGEAVILSQAAHSQTPWLIGLSGGLGMGLGEIPPYFLGNIGTSMFEEDERADQGWIRRWLSRLARWIDRFMERWAIPTIFVMSAIPNPFLEITSISAGAVGVPMRKFVPALVAGKLVRGVLLALIGLQLSLL